MTTTPLNSGGSGHCVARHNDHHQTTKTEKPKKKFSVGSDGLGGGRLLAGGGAAKLAVGRRTIPLT